jgi:tetratricopeptide (TPR) repeat protein
VVGGQHATGQATVIGSVGTYVQAPVAGGVPVVHAISGGQQIAPGVVFVGRHAETELLLAALAPDDQAGPAVSTVAGMGGVGKTALARFCAAEAVKRGWFAGGAYVVDLQGYSPGGSVPGSAVFAPLLHQLGVPTENVPADPAAQAAVYDQVLRVMARQGRRVLLVLDNASTATQVAGLVPASGGHRVVVTTRDTLAIPGARRLDLNVLTEIDAVALLNQALREQVPDDDRATDGGAVLVGVCGLLPLAVRIAAGLLADEPDTSCTELAMELAGTATDAFAHGETRVAPVLATSIDVLAVRAPQAAQLLRLLPVNPGPDISTEAAAALGGLSVATARTSLRALRQAHLINLVDRRWRLHDLVRRYLLDRLEESNAATLRLLHYYAMTATAANEHLLALPGRPVPEEFSGRDQALTWFDAEHANLVASVQSATRVGHAAYTIRLAFALEEYLHSWRRLFNDSLTVSQAALDMCQKSGKRLEEGAAWNALGHALRDLGRPDDAVNAHEHALDIFQKIGHRLREGNAFNQLGLALRTLGRLDEALAAHNHALAICQEFGDRRNEGTTWANLALTLQNMQHLDEAVTALEHACDIFREIGDRDREGVTWHNLAVVLRDLGRLTEAVTAHEHACDIFREVCDRHREGETWFGLAHTFLHLERIDEVRNCLSEAAAAYNDSGETDAAQDIRELLEEIDALVKTTGS